MISSAVLSECGLYRYRLERANLTPKAATYWIDGVPPAAGASVCWIMLNPSTADAHEDDPTIRRVVNFTRWWGYDSMVVVNLCAFRATDPQMLLSAAREIVGEDNDTHIADALFASSLVVAGWGAHGRYFPDRVKRVRQLAKEAGRSIHALAFTKDGHPKHPLYQPGELVPTVWVRA